MTQITIMTGEMRGIKRRIDLGRLSEGKLKRPVGEDKRVLRVRRVPHV